MSAPARISLPMPRLGETMEEGTIAEWLVTPGQGFARGDPLLEVETDKTMVEYPALGDGILVETLVGAGDVVAVGTPIAVIETASPWEGLDSADPDAPGDTAPDLPARAFAPQTASPSGATPSGNRLRATPAARRRAAQHGIALDDVTGSGRRGRIEAADIDVALAAKGRGAASPRAERALFVHGFAGVGSNWAALRARLQRVGLRGSAPDMPGHGRSPDTASEVADLVDWLSGVLTTEAAPVLLVGHSLGAHVAAQAALRAPDRVAGLVLLAPLGCGTDNSGTFVQGMGSSPGPEALADLMDLLGPTAAALDDRALDAMAQELAAGRLTSLASGLTDGDGQHLDTIATLRDLAEHMPVTTIFGLHDRIIPRDHAFHLPPDAAAHFVAAGHMPHWDTPGEVARIIAAHHLSHAKE